MKFQYPIGTEIFLSPDDDAGIEAAKDYAGKFPRGDVAVKRRTDEYGTRICVITLKALDCEG